MSCLHEEFIGSHDRVKVDLTKFVDSHQFTFDEIFDSACSNEEVCEERGLQLSVSGVSPHCLSTRCIDIFRC